MGLKVTPLEEGLVMIKSKKVQSNQEKRRKKVGQQMHLLVRLIYFETNSAFIPARSETTISRVINDHKKLTLYLTISR